MATDKERIEALIKARDELYEAKKSKCTCHGMGLQIDGCTCGRKEKIATLDIKFWAIMETIEAYNG